MVKNPPVNAGETGDLSWFLNREDSLEEEMATHSSILARRARWTEEPSGLLYVESQSQTRPSTHTCRQT